jgi:hypothetical protein
LRPESALAIAGATAWDGGSNLVSWATLIAVQRKNTASVEVLCTEPVPQITVADDVSLRQQANREDSRIAERRLLTHDGGLMAKRPIQI